MIYCDHASTSFIKPESVIQAVCEALKNGGNAHRGNSQVSLGAAQRLFEARRVIGSFFHAEDTHAVLFTSGATESLNMAIQGLF